MFIMVMDIPAWEHAHRRVLPSAYHMVEIKFQRQWTIQLKEAASLLWNFLP